MVQSTWASSTLPRSAWLYKIESACKKKLIKVKKILIVFGIAFFIFLITIPLISYKASKLAIKEEVFNHLTSVRELLKHEIESYFHERFGDVDVLARNPVISQGFSRLSKAFNSFGSESSRYLTVAGLYQPLMEHYVADYGYVNVFLVDKDGDVIFSVKEEEFSGTNLLTGSYKQFSIGQVFKRGMEEVTFEDYTWHDDLGEFTSYFAAPIYDNQLVLGVLIIEIPFAHLDVMLTKRSGLGETGEMYMVGEDGFMRSNSRFSEEPTILQQEVDTEATRDALEGKAGTKIIDDYRGVSVLSAYTPLNLKFVEWVLLVEIDEEEAFAPIYTIETRLIVIGTIIIAIAILYLYLTRRRGKKHEVSELVEESTS